MSVVYLIGPQDWRLGRVKIGRTQIGPLNRLAQFQTGSPFKLALYGYFPGGVELEGLLHETFASLRFHGEWFDTRGRLLAFMSNLYFSNYGARSLSDIELDRMLYDTMMPDEPPHPSFCDQSEWEDSADVSRLGDWLHDRAWAAYQAGNEFVKQ